MKMSCSRRRRQGGWVAIGLAVLGATAAGWLLLSAALDRQQSGKVLAAHGRDRALDWAQSAVQQFAARHARLPCPARVVDGPEDCAAGFKGWLPTSSLTSAAARIGSVPAHYLVYRGDGGIKGPDLAGPVVDRYSPSLADGSDGGAASHLTGLDLCEALRRARPIGRWGVGDEDQLYSNDVAYVQSGSRATTVAFALVMAAVPGQESESPALNADLSRPAFEIGAAPNATADLARFTTFGSLSEQLACSTAALALDTLAIGSSMASAAQGSKEANIQAGHDTGDLISSFFVASDGMAVINARQDIVNGNSSITASLAKIAALIPELPESLPAIKVQEAAITTAGQGVTFAKIDLIRNSIGLLVDSAYLAAYKVVAQQAGEIPVWTGGAQWLDEADAAGLVVAGGQ